MASTASPPILPVSSIHPSGSSPLPSSVPVAGTPISTPAFRIFLSRLSNSVRRSLEHRRPWYELYDRSAFSRPETLSDATSRVRKNYTYFRVNYLAFLAAVLIFSLLSHPFSLLVLLSLLGSWCFFYLFRPSDSPLVILGRTFSNRETLFALLLTSFLVIFLTSVGSLLISAIMVGAAIICVHGAFRVPEDLFLDEQEPPGSASGFLSFLGNASAASGAVRV
ncbi:PRA1 family protein B2 [Platanthera guangdongensis]|uniref:PRA1 family protein n=1 Tax=Platanthera guangdongensis TaxID=2320717 RepID=A0ABR2M902_9ASPA